MDREELKIAEDIPAVVEFASKPMKRNRVSRSELSPQLGEVVDKILFRMKQEEANRGAAVTLELGPAVQNTLSLIKQRHMKEGLDFSTADFLNKLIENALGCDDE